MTTKNHRRDKRQEQRQSRIPAISPHALKRVRYWLQSLNDGARLSAVADIDIRSSIEIGIQQLFSEKTYSEDPLKLFFKTHYDNHGRQGLLPILISPIRITPEGMCRGSRPVHNLLHVPALLTEQGALLSPQGDALPWIPREFLEPGAGATGLSISSMEDSEEYFIKHHLPARASFSAYWRYAINFFEYATSSPLSEFSIDGFQKLSNISLIIFENNQRSVHSLIKTLEEVSAGLRHQGTLRTLANQASRKPEYYNNSKYQLFKNARSHTAHTSAKFALSLSQRQAVHRYLETKPGEVFCVNGPPGTGKTTVLQSFIVSSWTQAAIENKDSPPVMLVCGATNQSVTNVIDSFNQLAKDASSPMAQRWLPELSSYGTFCASAEKLEKVQGYLTESRRGLGFSAKVETTEYLEKAKKYFLKNYTATFGTVSSLDQAIKRLNLELQKNQSSLSQALTTALEVSVLDLIFQKFRPMEKDSERDLIQRASEFDLTRRYQAFLLATHYWEAKWLVEMEKELEIRSRRKDLNVRFRNRTEDWQRRAMLTPVFVSTTAMACTFFSSDSNRSSPPIDVIFFDEAGQIPSEQGVAPIALAKKAVVIGDIEQLEPYALIPPHLDILNLDAAGLLTGGDHDTAFRNLIASGITASSNNLMEFCLNYCRHGSEGTVGAFLAEHRRSVPELISFCNQLSYRGRLIPARAAMGTRILPPFGFLQVIGPNFKSGSSRYNDKEAEAILIWLKSNKEQILNFYGTKELSSVLAILTPFSAQARQIKKALKNSYPGLIIGTVNALQGAEKNIVLFSSVYDDQYKGATILDRNKRILNVAVSRAKDTFIIFGSNRLLSQEREGTFPTKTLGQYIFSTPGSDLKLP